ncbi:hypothetical protein [Mycolicibacterium fluoranthenivorans]|uniref:Minor tail protein n=1 Tax=Mycolicibacterium fluoranthenivorans TaxID=258505 RepID=A0A7X5U5N4_9MYCO|nr:hypothetical protein [Mycolicibacterium fluoranthenivorans]NIH98883.1 hypothetical protein [Mycolicibacterium fluoranthenivorans]
MTATPLRARIMPYQKTAAALATENDIPLQGERVRETDTGREKTGDGETHYNDLDYDDDPAKLDGVTETGLTVLTGDPAAARAAIGAVSTTDIAAAVNNVINGAPGALDTLNELATALGDDANFAATVTNALAGKAAAAAVLLSLAANPDQLATGTITRSATSAATGFSVSWPDGATGTFTGTESTSFPGAIDSYVVTHVLSAVTTTYTQPALTRDSSGAVTNRPAIVVS